MFFLPVILQKWLFKCGRPMLWRLHYEDGLDRLRKAGSVAWQQTRVPYISYGDKVWEGSCQSRTMSTNRVPQQSTFDRAQHVQWQTAIKLKARLRKYSVSQTISNQTLGLQAILTAITDSLLISVMSKLKHFSMKSQFYWSL